MQIDLKYDDEIITIETSSDDPDEKIVYNVEDPIDLAILQTILPNNPHGHYGNQVSYADLTNLDFVSILNSIDGAQVVKTTPELVANELPAGALP